MHKKDKKFIWLDNSAYIHMEKEQSTAYLS